jgi:hypothetical protein
MTAKATIDHATIRNWVERNGGCPVRVQRAGEADHPGELQIALSMSGESPPHRCERISWERFFYWFDENELALLYQDQSRSSRLVHRGWIRQLDRFS